jgi:hypothetical protein
VIAAAWYIPFFVAHGFPTLAPGFLRQGVIEGTISEFGSRNGFSVFVIMLAMVQFLTTWKGKREYLPLYIGAIFLGAASLVYPGSFNPFLLVIVPPLAGSALVNLLRREWSTPLIRIATICIILLGVIVPWAASFQMAANDPPSRELVDSLVWLRSHSPPQAVVLSHYKNGFWVEDIAERRVVMDENVEFVRNASEVYNLSNEVFYSRDIKLTTQLLDELNVTIILIDRSMKGGLVWSDPKEGLLFVLGNEEVFRQVYNNTEVEIWRYPPPRYTLTG